MKRTQPPLIATRIGGTI